MKTETDINQELDQAMEKYMRENRRLQNGAISEVDEARIEILDILSKYAGDNGTIPKEKVRAILRELGEVESSIENRLTESIDETIDRTTDKAIKWSTVALGSILAAGLISVNKIKRDVRENVLNRKTSDGLSLNDRLQRLSGNLVDDVRKDIRSGILRGASVAAINRDIKKTVDKSVWQVRRLVMTEGNNAYRKTIGEVAIASKVVKAVRIIDNRGRHPNHESHECYRLAEQDMYGWGKGVYRPQDSFIYYPHPNCTAYYRFVLVDTEKGKVI